ncbi:PREDICTED: F-box protein At5g51380-like [Camelina sativa]|uniref:F-box protein At5g51380-like n=1 Tax=Camelina sativa TaxID=90675 RepID=A0ABM0X903_CAMSA|nr:PREDICTED: F-box protein At5g51380-like [Camelina sativa]
MSFREKMPTSPKSPLRRRRSSWTGPWLNHPTTSFKQAVSAVIQAQSPRSRFKSAASEFSDVDRTLSLSDSIILRILEKLPESQSEDVSLVCKRWLYLQGRRLKNVKVLNWDFLMFGRLTSRFPKLTSVDLVNACLNPSRSSGILLCHKSISFHVSTDSSSDWDFVEENLLHCEMVDRGVRVLGRGSCDLLKLVVINATEMGLLSLAEDCSDLQELELHKCSDNLLRGIAACENLRALRLVGIVDGLYSSSVSDIGLTILAQGCKRLVKLELSGCEGSFDGVKAIGQCCEVLEELSICDHRMDDGWIAALSYFESLKTLRISSCRKIDSSPGPEKLLGSCPALESLQLIRCCLNDKEGMRALFKVCDGVTKVNIQDCWGLDDDSFSVAKAFRRVRFLSLEGCSVLTTSGLESVILHWEELESMRVVSCKNIKDSEISAALSSLFSLLKELTWRPDTRSHLSSSLEGAGIGKRGSKFFKKR